MNREKLVVRAGELSNLLRDDEKVQKVVALGVLAGLLAYAVAGLKGLVVLGVLAAVAAWLRPVRQRVLRWYLLA